VTRITPSTAFDGYSSRARLFCDPGRLFFIVLILRSVRYAYESLGVSSSAAIFLLFAALQHFQHPDRGAARPGEKRQDLIPGISIALHCSLAFRVTALAQIATDISVNCATSVG
jgi:hypothetical protein